MRRLACTLAAITLVGTAPLASAQPPTSPSDKQIVAVVNGVPITRGELADELIQHRGKSHLEGLINRRVIEQACAKAGIRVSEKEVEDELRELMRGANCTTATQFEKQMVRPMLHISLSEYKEFVLKQGIMTRRLAGTRVQVTEDDLRRAFDSKYGERVQCRIIVEKSLRVVTDMHTKIAGDRLKFLNVAKQQADAQLARFAGQIPPIGRFSSNDDLEKRAFELKDGEVSEVLQLPQGGFAILLREAAVPPDQNRRFEDEKQALLKEVTEYKLAQEVPKLVDELKAQARIENYLGSQSGDIKSLLEKLDGEKK